MLEGALEGGVDGAQIVGADGRAIDAVPVRVGNFSLRSCQGQPVITYPGVLKVA